MTDEEILTEYRKRTDWVSSQQNIQKILDTPLAVLAAEKIQIFLDIIQEDEDNDMRRQALEYGVDLDRLPLPPGINYENNPFIRKSSSKPSDL